MDLGDYPTNVTEYLNEFYSSASGHRRSNLFNLHDFYEEYHTQWDIKTAKMLEFGGRANISQLISAGRFVNEMEYAAFTDEERTELNKWIKNEAGTHDWTNIFKYVVTKLEGEERDEAWKEREAMIRSKVKNVCHCDISQADPIGRPAHGEFDIISTHLFLEAVCKTYEQYKFAIKNIASMLKPGGYIVMEGVEEQTYYESEGKPWHSLSLTLPQMKAALQEAGLEMVELKRKLSHYPRKYNDDCKAMVFIAAVKK